MNDADADVGAALPVMYAIALQLAWKSLFRFVNHYLLLEGRVAFWGAKMAATSNLVFRALLQAADNMVGNAAVEPPELAFAIGPSSLADWVAVGISVIASIAVVNRLYVLIARFPEPEKRSDIAFVMMLCDQLWDCSNRITAVFAQRLRQPPDDVAALRILVRHLREDLSIPMNFITQMRAHPPGDWPNPAILNAFTNWSAQIVTMSQQLDDLHQTITYPLVREPLDKHRDATLVHQYWVEQAFLDRRVDDVSGRAYQFCAAASAFLKAARSKTATGNTTDDGHHDCPCCKRPPEQHRVVMRDPLLPIVLPAPPVPPPPSKPQPPTPAPIACFCKMPRACQCRQACMCVCHCVAVPVSKVDG